MSSEKPPSRQTVRVGCYFHGRSHSADAEDNKVQSLHWVGELSHEINASRSTGGHSEGSGNGSRCWMLWTCWMSMWTVENSGRLDGRSKDSPRGNQIHLQQSERKGRSSLAEKSEENVLLSSEWKSMKQNVDALTLLNTTFSTINVGTPASIQNYATATVQRMQLPTLFTAERTQDLIADIKQVFLSPLQKDETSGDSCLCKVNKGTQLQSQLPEAAMEPGPPEPAFYLTETASIELMINMFSETKGGKLHPLKRGCETKVKRTTFAVDQSGNVERLITTMKHVVNSSQPSLADACNLWLLNHYSERKARAFIFKKKLIQKPQNPNKSFKSCPEDQL